MPSTTIESGWGRISIAPVVDGGPDTSLFGIPTPHARLTDGRTVIWNPADWIEVAQRHTAIDAECLTAQVPSRVRGYLGCTGLLAHVRWTRLEILAKLSDEPSLLILRNGMTWKDVVCRTYLVADIVATIGVRFTPVETTHPRKEGENDSSERPRRFPGPEGVERVQ